MDATHAPTPADQAIPPQVPFSWTLRWARAHRSDGVRAARRTYRIAGAVESERDLEAALSFCREHGAKLELD